MAQPGLISAFAAAAQTARASSAELVERSAFDKLSDRAESAPLAREPSLEQQRWRSAITRISKANSFSKSFKTLRDMTGESFIEQNRLTRVKSLGTGAFAAVDLYKLSPREGQGPPTRVAVKYMHPQLLRDQRELESFAQEAKLLRKLQHPSIVQFIGVGGETDKLSNAAEQAAKQVGKAVETSHTLIVQEYLDGGTLKKMLLAEMSGSRQTYSNAEALTWMRQVAEGLNYLHTANPRVIHRDLKLDNVLMRRLPDKKLHACLCDFGLSALVRQQDVVAEHCQKLEAGPKSRRSEESLQQLERQVQSRLHCTDSAHSYRGESQKEELAQAAQATYDLTGQTGSHFYMAPEVVFSRPYNEKVDVFAFAIIMLETFSRIITSTIVTGPTYNPRAAELYAVKVAKGYRRPLPESWPTELQTLIQDCWSQQPDDRPTMEQCVRRLKLMEAAGVFPDRQHAQARQGCCIVM